MKKLTTKLTTYQQDVALRVGNFFLMPEAPFPPAIASDLPNNVTQKTFIKEFVDGTPIYEDMVLRNSTYSITAGTELEMIIVAQDPSLIDLNYAGNESNLIYQWFKDGAPLVPANSLRNGRGFRGVRLPAEEVTLESSGEYYCEISNAYGTTTTTSVFISVVDPRRHPLMYKNLITNGSANGGTDGWVVDDGIISRAFLDEVFVTYHHGSLPPFGYYDDDLEKTAPATIPHDFRFSQSGASALLWPAFKNLLIKNPNAFKQGSKSNINDSLPDWMAWTLRSMPPNIVANEDISLGSTERAGFFPGIKWMDLYNNNNNPSLIGLDGECVDRALNYFTRDKLKFERAGGRSVASLSQIIDVESASALIDNTVLGVPPIFGQFFSYVGAGITGYKIKVTTEAGEEEFNWYILDPSEFFERLKTSTDNRIAIQEGSVIEIIPLVEDQTTVTITMRDSQLSSLSQVKFEGPDATDVFAIKEKSYFPLTWYPIFDLLVTNNNPIKIFGKTYSTTKALQPLMSPNPAIPEKEIVDVIFELEINDLYSKPAKNIGIIGRNKVKDLILDYMGAVLKGSFMGGYIDKNNMSQSQRTQIQTKGSLRLENRKDVESLLLRATIKKWTIEDLIDDRKTKGEFYKYNSPNGHPKGSKEYDIERQRSIYKNVADIIMAQDKKKRIKVKVVETPVYQVVNVNNESTPIYECNTSGMDRNAAFYLNNFPFKEGGRFIPTEAAEWDPYKRTAVSSKRTYKAMQEQGAAAMFGIGGNFRIPEKTTTIEITITFTNTSPAFSDGQPELKGWMSDFMYCNEFGDRAANATRFREYGYPRCGITMAKFLLLPQDATPESNYTSYYIPSQGNQVWGLQKRMIYDESFTDTSKPGDFIYHFVMPENPGIFNPVDIYELGKAYETYEKGRGYEASKLNPGWDETELEQFQQGVEIREDASTDRIENDSVIQNEEEGLSGLEQEVGVKPNLNTDNLIP